LNDFWNAESYLEHIEENFLPADEYLVFAKSLSFRRSFTHFMDGFIDEIVVNFDLCNSILCQFGLLNKRYKEGKSTLDIVEPNFQKMMSGDKVKDFLRNYHKYQKDTRFRFDDEVVRFNFKIPSYLHRQMLLEKIQYLAERHKNKKDKYARSSSQHKGVGSNKELEKLLDHKKVKYYYDRIIKRTRDVYETLINEDKKPPEIEK
jgi:hypothetical protein